MALSFGRNAPVPPRIRFVIFEADGMPLRDLHGRLVMPASRAEARALAKPRERIEPCLARLHPLSAPEAENLPPAL